jgi:hypothetical protein
MRDMFRVDASIFREVDVYWDVTKFIDTAVLLTVAGCSEGSDGYEWIGNGHGGPGGEEEERLQQRNCKDTNRLAGGWGGLSLRGEQQEQQWESLQDK